MAHALMALGKRSGLMISSKIAFNKPRYGMKWVTDWMNRRLNSQEGNSNAFASLAP